MKVFLILFLLIMLLLLFPLKIKSKVIYNLMKNNGFVSFYFYNIRLFVGRWKFVPFKLIIKGKKKDVVIGLSNLQTQNDYKDIYINQLMKKIKINNVRSYVKFGFNKDALITSLGGAGLKILSGVACCLLSLKESKKIFMSQVYPDYTNTILFICVTASIQLNLIIIIYCFFSSFILNIKRGSKKYGNKKTS